MEGEVRCTLLDVCLLGSESAITRHGEHVTIGLLLVQFAELRESTGMPEQLLLHVVRLVREDLEEAPEPDEVFTLRWLTPPRLARLEGRAWKRVLAS